MIGPALKILSAVLGLPRLIKDWLYNRKWLKAKQKISDQAVEIAEFEGKETKDEIIREIESSPNRLRTLYDRVRKRNNTG